MNKNVNKHIKRIIAATAFIGGAMYAFNKFIDYTASCRCLTLDENENYYKWRNGTIYYQKKGTGTPLLLIHDLSPISSSYEWSKVIGQLSQTHTVYAIDLIGCGKSDKPASTYINYMYVQLLNDFILDVIGQKTDIVVTGESFSFAVMAARMNQDCIGKITAINPTDIIYNVQSPDKKTDCIKKTLELPLIGTFIYNLIANIRTINNQFTKKYFKDVSKISPNLPDIYYECAHLKGSNGKYLYASILGKYTNINIIHALKLIENPIHFILTEASSDDIVEYTKYNDNITIDRIKNNKYLPQLENPEDIIALIV